MCQRKIILGFYDQKPLGTRKEDFEFSLYSCYKPLLTFLYTNPEIRISLYFSGIIFEWLENEYPEINMLITDMVKRKQIELLTGGFYDPIFQIIPKKDRTLQIEKTTTYIRKRFGIRPRCAWISEQVWNPMLINTLFMCGIKSILQFQGNQTGMDQPYYMQDMGKIITIFPVEKTLSSLLLRNEMDGFSQEISQSYNSDTTQTITLMLDMNRIISNSIIVSENNIVELCKVFQETCTKQDITCCLVSEETKGGEQLKQHYLPYGWYNDNRINKVNQYNELFLKYPEIQLLYGKLLYVSRLIPGIKKEKSLKKLALKELLKAESFGSFSISQNGGFYQNYIRKNNYSHLIEVEKITREKGVFSTAITLYDVDLDNENEFIYRGKNITSVFDRVGASMIEFDYLVNSWNYLDTFVGHSEDIIARSITSMPDGIKQQSFNDLFIYPDATTECYDKYSDNSVYTLESRSYEVKRLDKDKKQIEFSTDFNGPLDSGDSVLLEKMYTCYTNSIQVDYTITNKSKSRFNCKFGSEINISFAYNSDGMIQMYSADLNHIRNMAQSEKSMNNVKIFRIDDLSKKAIISIQADKRYRIIRQSYTTTIDTLMGEEEIYQFSRLLAVWQLDIKPGESWSNRIVIRIEKMK